MYTGGWKDISVAKVGFSFMTCELYCISLVDYKLISLLYNINSHKICSTVLKTLHWKIVCELCLELMGVPNKFYNGKVTLSLNVLNV